MADPVLSGFLNGQIDSCNFSHADHVRAAFGLLQRDAQNGFVTAAAALTAGLKSMAARAGEPQAYHATMTLAFLSLIAERRAEQDFGLAEAFTAANPDLMDKAVITRWYTPARLSLERARAWFILPDPLR